jgi:hypothetical protein
MKQLFVGFLFISVIVVIVFVFSNITSRFVAGDCIINSEDKYIWMINDYSGGEYNAMGWQGNGWGNVASFKKEILERDDYQGKPLYNKTICPRLDVR